MKKRNVIYVTVEGGVLQNIDGLPKDTTLVVMDFDIEGHEGNETTKWFVEDQPQEAYVGIHKQEDGLPPSQARAHYYNLKRALKYEGRPL